ncbi:MAG: hypothetical protein Q8N87_01380 [bacterium]|nr:hypothetical protein [bacterium]
MVNYCLLDYKKVKYIKGRRSITAAGEEDSIDKVSVEEKRCIGLGDDFCGFLIKF